MGRHNILVVDDDSGTCDICVRVLKMKGYEATGVESPITAIELVSKEKFDLLLADVKMPEMTGLELIKRVKQINTDMAIVIITAYASLDVVIDAVQSQVYGFIRKPFGPDQLCAVVADVLEEQAIAREKRMLAYQQQLQSLASGLSLVEERERRRIATALHESVCQTLAASKIRLDILRTSTSSTDMAASLDEIDKLIDQAVQEARSLTYELSPPVLYDLGLEPAVGWLTQQTQKQHNLLTRVEDDGQPKPLDDDVRVVLFHAVRELLTNVVKHAQARYAKVSIRREDKNIRVQVEDDGVGFDPSEIGRMDETGGFGLFNIRERLEYLGGESEIKSELGYGTQVTLVAPLKQDG